MTLQWWDAWRRTQLSRGLISFDVPPPKIATGPVSMRLEQAPRLRVWRGRFTRRWCWRVTDGHFGTATTHGEALAVGLAALEQATARTPA